MVPAIVASEPLPDVSGLVAETGARVSLPFDVDEVVTNLRRERYRRPPGGRLERLISAGVTKRAYYLARPWLPVSLRKHLQRLRLSDWRAIPFPEWPVDLSVDTLMKRLMAVVLRRQGLDRLPFVWFWPDGAESCVLMTHDVEGPSGQAFCARLIGLDDTYGIKSAFQVIPERLGAGLERFVASLRERGCEVNLHDLAHDGSLFDDRARFERRAKEINQHARRIGARGFRSAVMYRNQDWYGAFEVAYDMSVPNVAHLEPQRGGCCTVMPYFVGDVLEMPLTTTQDYSLFHVLNEYSTRLWEEQIARIRAANGLISFITHPDYLREAKARAVYTGLLAHLARLTSEGRAWMALPGEIDRWWRERQQMSVVLRDGRWSVQGPGSERARVAYAVLADEDVVFEHGGEG